MKALLFIFSLIFVTAAAETDSEKPAQICFDSSADCVLLLLQKSRAEFVVDDSQMFEAVRSLQTDALHLGVRLVTPQTKAALEAAARETNDILRVANENLVKLRREGMAAISSRNGCALLTGSGGFLYSVCHQLWRGF